MPRADQATIDLLTDYFDAMEAKDHGRLGSYYADNITLTFANAPIVTGSDAVLAQMTTLLGKVKSLAHYHAKRRPLAPRLKPIVPAF
jgi:ketosteroid isomerase-like protein